MANEREAGNGAFGRCSNGGRNNQQFLMNMYFSSVKVFVIELLVCFFIPYGASAKTHQMGVVDTLRGAIEVYSDINGHAPSSWSELMSNGDTKLVQRLIGKEGEFVHGFRFLNSGTEVHIGPEKDKVLAMSTTAWYRHESKGDSRILFFLTADGLKIDIIEETSVRRIFTKWGYNLDDYTGPSGKWES